MHPRFELPPVPEITKDQQQKRAPTCHFCGEVGHKASYCQKMPPEVSAGRDLNPTPLFRTNGNHFRTFMRKLIGLISRLIACTATGSVAATRGSQIPVLHEQRQRQRQQRPASAAATSTKSTAPARRDHLLQMRHERSLRQQMPEGPFGLFIIQSSLSE